MKNLMVTLALVVGLLSTSVSFADEVTSMDKAQVQHLSAFDGIETNLASNSELDNASGEVAWVYYAAVYGIPAIYAASNAAYLCMRSPGCTATAAKLARRYF